MSALHDMPARSVYVRLQIDTNRINARGALPSMNQLEKWRSDGVIEILTSHVAFTEMRRGGSAARSRKTEGMIFSLTQATTSGETEQLGRIQRILFPDGAQTENEKNDVEIVFNAMKYMAILVTNDGGSNRQPGGMLGNRSALKRALGVRIMSDTETAEYIREKIDERDEMARMIARQTRAPLPDWIGRD